MSTTDLGQNIEKALSLAISFDDICFRNVKHGDEKYLLDTARSAERGYRFNPPGVAMLYLSCDHFTCLAESTYLLQEANLSIGIVATLFPRDIFALRVKLSSVLDLTNENVRRLIGVNEADLLETDWEAVQADGLEAVTQTMGRLAKAAGFEALLVPSARYSGNNLNLFYPDGLLASSSVQIIGVGS